MKIAMVVPGGIDPSGEYRVIPALLALVRRLASRHELHVFALAQEARPAKWNFEGAHIHNIGRPFTRARAIASILRENRAGSFQLVHSIWAGWCGAVAVTAAKILRLPAAVHVAGGELAALPRIRYGGTLTWKGRMREAWVLRGAAAVTAASEPAISRIAAFGCKARRIPLGVDMNVWPSRAPVRRAPGDQPRLIHVASLNRVKDQPTLLNAMAVLATARADFHLDVAGEDTLHGEMQALAARLGLGKRVAFHGFLTQRQLRPLLERAHINVVSSLHEAGPVVVLEAAVAGVPTAGTAVGHIAEWAPKAALCVPIGDAPALGDAIRRLLDDEDVRLAIAAAAQSRALAENADFTAAQFEALYAELARA
ncbi:MAG TPA: glycosyltransferase family 4 protein [Candidatus Acidoferrales bacterium]|nr:glycosyltransferase family 4 protein [Candidatus Acidoferrales bacterium]